MKLLTTFALLSLINVQVAKATANMSEELDPFAPNIEAHLEEMDAIYGEDQPLLKGKAQGRMSVNGCYQRSCDVYLEVDKSLQKAQLFIEGTLVGEFATSSGGPGHRTPNMDLRPNGRIYDKYSSSKFPGGDYNGLGNMPYAVFLKGGFAIHGTPKGNWSKLGKAVSHGCIRVHPDNGFKFNRAVRKYGVKNSWVTIR